MAYTSGFFDAVDLGGGDYDRVYTASAFAHYFSLLIKNGVFPDPSTGMQVVAPTVAGMRVLVSPGNGWINGYYVSVADASHELTVQTANGSLPRIDSVIMAVVSPSREIQLYIKQGTPMASPSPVTLQRDADVYELELAQITVGAGVAGIVQANIKDTRTNASRCGIVAGTVNQIDTTNLFAQYDSAFKIWFDDIQSQLAGDVATNLQNQINGLKTGKADLSVTNNLQSQINSLSGAISTVDSNKLDKSSKASAAEVSEGTIDYKWTTPLGVSYAMKMGERSSYLAFCSNVTAEALDAAFGKNNVNNMFGIGNQLAMYSWFKEGSSKPYYSLRNFDSLAAAYSNTDAFIEMESSMAITGLVKLSPYAKSIRDSVLTSEAKVCMSIAAACGLPNPYGYTTVDSLTSNATFMNSPNAASAFTYPLFVSIFCGSNTHWSRMSYYVPLMKAFESSPEVKAYLDLNKASVLSYMERLGSEGAANLTGRCVYIHTIQYNEGNWSDNYFSIKTGLSGAVYDIYGQNAGKDPSRQFFSPSICAKSGRGGLTAYYKNIP